MIKLDSPDECGNVLHRIREQAALRQSEVAAAAGVGAPALSQFERGANLPSLRTLILLAHALGYDLALVPRAGWRTEWAA